ncbi:type IV pilus modification PilV family protein [Piscinibacter sakaiensis]|uniref:type IV pilus modification PilV family protein n=1 Tax=Piscinibacter sakaiensis TaxID=1547922 RepID=UPI003AB08582
MPTSMNHFQPSILSTRQRRRGAAGFVLLEVLVALLIFAFGVLGVVGLQAAMTKAQTSAKFRGDAAYLAQELIGNMWSDIPNLDKYTKPAGDGNCTAHPKCFAIQQKIAAMLPAGQLVVEQPSPGLLTITISWTPPAETTHIYTTSTAIRT